MRVIIAILFIISINSQAQIINASRPYRPFAQSCDADAQKFIDSAGITSQTQIDAICTLVKDLKDSSLWSSMYAIYPFVGGTASSHKWNLKDPRDLDAAFRLTFIGAWTHDNNGVTPDGSSGYSNTFFNPTVQLSSSSAHISIYSRTDNSTGRRDIGVFYTPNALGITIRNDGLSSNTGYINNGSGYFGFSNTNSMGYYISNRNNSSDYQGYKNGTQIGTTTQAAASNNGNIFIGAWNQSGVAAGFSNRNYSFASIGSGLTTDNVRALNTIVEKFNDSLSRGVQ